MTMCFQTLGFNWTIIFQLIVSIVLLSTPCSCVTSASRMVYGFAREEALPFSAFLCNIDENLNSPVRAIWAVIFLTFVISLPSFGSEAVLSVLFSFNAVLLYGSYLIPCLLRVTTGRNSFVQSPIWNLGKYSYVFNCASVCMCTFWTIGKYVRV